MRIHISLDLEQLGSIPENQSLSQEELDSYSDRELQTDLAGAVHFFGADAVKMMVGNEIHSWLTDLATGPHNLKITIKE